MPDTEIRYSYKHAPTLKEFSASDAFIRGLMGPVGGGKSAACVIEIISRGLAQKPGPDGIRRSRWVVIRNCFDDQTEILTENRGWQFFKDLMPDERVASLHDGERLVYEVPTMHYAAPYKGEMIGVKNEGIDLLVTPEHHLWVTKTSGRDRKKTPYRHVEARDCYGMIDWHMKRDADWVGEESHYSEAFFEFLGFWFAEGYAGAYQYADRIEPHWRFVVTQTTHCEYTRELLSRVGLTFGESTKEDGRGINFVIRVTPELKPLVKELSLLGKSHEKRLLPWIKSASRSQLRAFIAGYIKGDGCTRADCATTVATTTSRRLADDIQEISLRAGYVVNVRSYEAAETNFGLGKPMHSMTFLSQKKYHPKTYNAWRKESYDAMVYCVEVSSHVVYVRRNGVAVWSGQTFGELRDTTIRTFHDWVPPALFGNWHGTNHEYTITGFQGAVIEVLFRALDRPDHVKKLLSLELTGAWVNEAREVPWAIINVLQQRVDRYPSKRIGGASWAGVILDTNPPDVDSEWFKFFENTDHSDAVATMAAVIPGMTVDRYVGVFKQPSGLSPMAENLPNLPAGYYQRLAAGKSAEWIKVYLKGEYGFVQEGLPVFPEFRDAMHMGNAKTIADLPVYRSWDFGLTPACVFSQITPGGQWCIVDEMVATSMGIDRFSDDVLSHSSREFPRREFRDVGDPAGMQRAQTDERTCFEIMRAKGIDIQPAPQTEAIRLESMRKALNTLVDGRPQVVLHPRCQTLRKAFLGGYAYKKRKASGGEPYEAHPEKNKYSHVMDAATYASAWLFGALLTAPKDYGPGHNDDVLVLGSDRSDVTGY